MSEDADIVRMRLLGLEVCIQCGKEKPLKEVENDTHHTPCDDCWKHDRDVRYIIKKEHNL